jgi:hypothetical protein
MLSRTCVYSKPHLNQLTNGMPDPTWEHEAAKTRARYLGYNRPTIDTLIHRVSPPPDRLLDITQRWKQHAYRLFGTPGDADAALINFIYIELLLHELKQLLRDPSVTITTMEVASDITKQIGTSMSMVTM